MLVERLKAGVPREDANCITNLPYQLSAFEAVISEAALPAKSEVRYETSEDCVDRNCQSCAGLSNVGRCSCWYFCLSILVLVSFSIIFL